VKYVLMIYSNPESWGHPIFLRTAEAAAMTEGERAQMTTQFETLIAEIAASGELVSVEALADPVTARAVRVREGAVVATDGPYVESREQMAGFWIVDVETPERAEEIAGRFPDARFAAVEMRPIMGSSGQEM
jgi:hypothetical protein